MDRSELRSLRKGRNQGEPILDSFTENEDTGPFQRLDIECPATETTWPTLFEKYLPSKVQLKQCKTRSHGRMATQTADDDAPAFPVPFQGQGQDGDNGFCSSGWLTALPPQQGIPGWRRFAMMRYHPDEFGQADLSDLWAYEGIVLPGDQIILGRWFHPDGVTNIEVSSAWMLMLLRRSVTDSLPAILWPLHAMEH